jgi:uncharacterized membrane protein YhaH (DUF805 family)
MLRGIELFVLCFVLPSVAVILRALHDERKRKLAAPHAAPPGAVKGDAE